jgi:hypothetical protein
MLISSLLRANSLSSGSVGSAMGCEVGIHQLRHEIGRPN